MRITKLNWISKTAKEAELTISDGTHECLVFSQPCSMQLNETITEPLHAMDIEDLMEVLDQNVDEEINKTNESYFSHYCIARIINRNESIVCVGGIMIQLETSMPGWVKEDHLVEFKCSRLDIW